MRRWIRVGAVVALIVSASYIAYLKSSIYSKEALILSITQLVCFYGAILFGVGSIVVLVTDGVIGLARQIRRLTSRQ